ncbi:hypothetical protein BDE02_19G004300 [Populus trichocarpa]|nr:hypothetical protein BDE02_19G004300 [Populus trichocarpa]
MRNTATKLVHVDNSKDFFSCTSYSSCTGRGTAASRTSNKRSTFSILHHEQTQLEQNSLLSRSLQQPSTIQSSILLCVSKTQQKPVERGRTKRQRTREDEEESKTRRRERPIRQCTSAVGFVSSNPANQLDQDFREFFLAGNPRQESQSQRSSYQRGQYEGQRGRQDEGESWREQHERSRNVFSGFNEQILAEAFNIDTKLARRMQNENDNRGIIVRAQHELQVISPRQSQEEEERQQESRRSTRRRHEDNGVEETFCTARLKLNINDPEDADVFNPRAGRLTTVNSLNLPILRHVQLSAERGVLYANALMSPHWNINAHSIMYITGGNGRIQIVGDNGQAVFDGQVRKGQVVTAPQNFAVVMKAGSQGLEWVSFKTNDNAQISQLAGRVSTIRALPDEVVANSFQISREDARRLKNNRDEVSVLTASRQSQYERD